MLLILRYRQAYEDLIKERPELAPKIEEAAAEKAKKEEAEEQREQKEREEAGKE